MPDWNHSTDWHVKEDNFSDRGSAFPSRVNCFNAPEMLEGRDAIQKNFDRCEEWTYVNFMRFSKAKYTVPHLGKGNPKNKYRQGREQMESSPEEKDLGLFVDEQLNMTQLTAHKDNHILDCIKSSAGCRGSKVILPFYSALMRPHLECFIQLHVP